MLAGKALEWGADYLFMVDDDMMAPADLFYRLVKHDVDIVAPLAFTRNPPHRPVMFSTVEGFDPVTKRQYYVNNQVKNYPRNKLVECDAVGFGAVLIKTEVFKKIQKPSVFRDASDRRGCDIVRQGQEGRVSGVHGHGNEIRDTCLILR